MPDIVVDLWGPLACFSASGMKTERYSADVPTPSAIRGCLSAIYSKPVEFYWQIKKIEVMNPIKRISVKKNEVKKRMSGNKGFYVEDARTQRTTVYLSDVYYRVTAFPAAHKGINQAAIYSQAERRIAKGQCFSAPYLGLRECVCYFAPADMSRVPIDETRDLNLMVYDTHVPYTQSYDESDFAQSLFRCRMEHGVINVPDYDSADVIKLVGGGTANAAGIV